MSSSRFCINKLFELTYRFNNRLHLTVAQKNLREESYGIVGLSIISLRESSCKNNGNVFVFEIGDIFVLLAEEFVEAGLNDGVVTFLHFSIKFQNLK